MKVYRGRREGSRPGNAIVERVEFPERSLPMAFTVSPLPHFVKHSPDGFEWGYAGSGPSELARCLLIDALGEEAACRVCRGYGAIDDDPGDPEVGPQPHVETCWECGGSKIDPSVERNYQQFKFDVIAGLPGDDPWEMSQAQVVTWYRIHGVRVRPFRIPVPDPVTVP